MAPGDAVNPIVIGEDSEDSDDDEVTNIWYDKAVQFLLKELMDQTSNDPQVIEVTAMVDLVLTEDFRGKDQTVRMIMVVTDDFYVDVEPEVELFLTNPPNMEKKPVTAGPVHEFLCNVVVPTIPHLGRTPQYLGTGTADGILKGHTTPMCHLVSPDTYDMLHNFYSE